MAKSLPQPPLRSARGKRFSLRTLFFVSIAIALPFLLLANVQHSTRPEQSVASPMYLMLGIAGVVVAAAIGSALGSKTSMLVAASLAAFCWIGAVVLCGLFSKEQAARHFELIRRHLSFPDGVRLMDRPMVYRGGPSRTFRRAESAANFGREVGLQYVHAHIRYVEAMARKPWAVISSLP